MVRNLSHNTLIVYFEGMGLWITMPLRILLVEAVRCFCGEVRLGHYLSACCFMSRFLRHALTTGTYYSTPHSSQHFESAWLKVVHWSSSVHVLLHFTICSMPSKAPEILSCECYLYHYNNPISVLLKKKFLFSFSFYSGCSLGRGSHCVFPATPCSKNCMCIIPTL